eukprot:14505596-Alexandrium_andersonii.AAC.1
MAKTEKGPKFHVEEAAAPEGPRNGLVPRSDSAEVGHTLNCSSERRNLGIADFRRFRARGKADSPPPACWAAG